MIAFLTVDASTAFTALLVSTLLVVGASPFNFLLAATISFLALFHFLLGKPLAFTKSFIEKSFLT